MIFRREWRKIIWLVLSFLLIFGYSGLLLSQRLLPHWLGKQLETGIRAGVQSAARVEVQIGSVPLWELMVGRLRSVHIDLRHLVTKEGFPINSLIFDTDQVVIDLGTLLGEGQLQIKNLGATHVTVVLTAADLTSYFRSHIDALSEVQVELAEGVILLRGKLSLLGQKLNASVGGELEISSPTTIRYRPISISVERLNVPRLLLAPVTKALDFTIDLGKLPLPLVLDTIRIETGRIFVYGRNP